MTRRAKWIAVAVVAFGATYWAMGREWIPSYSSEYASIVRGATRVEVFRVSAKKSREPIDDAIGGYPILAKGDDQGQEFASRLSAALLSGYVTQNRKKCLLEPGVAFRLWNGNEAVEVLICFKCDVLWPYIVGAPHDEHISWEWRDFDPIRADLLALAKEAFPDDAEIQELSATGRD